MRKLFFVFCFLVINFNYSNNTNSPFLANYTITVTASSSSNYTLSGTDLNGTVSGDDPALTFNVGDQITFSVNASGHPFYLKTVAGTGTDNLISGVTNNGTESGNVVWTPNAAGTYYYQCSAHSGMVGTITITAVNDAPVAVADVLTIDEDASLTSTDVISNDTDVDGDTLSLTAVSTDGTGTVAVNSDGLSVDYTPAANFNGTETITYTVSDGTLTDETGTLTITITAVNDAPVAVADVLTVDEDASLTSTDVISNDTDVDGDTLSLTAVSTDGTGTVAVNSDGLSVDYTPAANFNGTETITYTVSDGTLTDETGTLTVTVNILVPSVTSIVLDETSIAENGSAATLTGTISAAHSKDVTIPLTITGTATIDTDYSTAFASKGITTVAGGDTYGSDLNKLYTPT